MRWYGSARFLHSFAIGDCRISLNGQTWAMIPTNASSASITTHSFAAGVASRPKCLKPDERTER